MTDDRFARPTGQHLRRHGGGGLLRIRGAATKARWRAKHHHTHGASLDHTHADDGASVSRGDANEDNEEEEQP
jgi:hypothetical protein